MRRAAMRAIGDARCPATTMLSTDDERPAHNQFMTTGGLSCHGIVPRFDLAQAKRLLQKGASPKDVIAAAVRLGDEPLRRSIEALTRCDKAANA